jgi:hypothetical protein
MERNAYTARMRGQLVNAAASATAHDLLDRGQGCEGGYVVKSSSCLLAATVFLSLGAAQNAAADPILITSGSMLVTGRFETGSIVLTGTRGFSLRAGVDPGEGEVSAMSRCSQEDPGCTGGSTISIGANLVGSGFPNGVATLDGTTFEHIDDINSPATVLLRLTGNITLPSFQTSPLVVTAPFAIGPSAFLLPSPTQPVEIEGLGGTATLFLVPGRETEGAATPWVLDQIRYDFSGAAPIPEPGTVLLVTAGMAGAWWRRRRQRPDGSSL